MTKQEIGHARRKLRRLETRLAGIGPVMRGSVVRIGMRNKQFYFTLNKDKKTRLIYLGDQREPLARKLSANYRKLVAIIEEMTVLNMALLKNDALE
jgi:chemotaxis receptor (MCP) glutamine deamidase CheD